ncbi:MAG: PD40 domain-containing protein [Alphaproteobacteria bacterium]|nr:PD40 domain-containing protein [Alphaproteobacteria bacterium]
MNIKTTLLAGAAWLALGAGAAQADPLLLQHPSLSASQIAFDYGGAIWTVPRHGGKATLLVLGQDQNSQPIFSPDGSQIAFTGRYDGNTDVYVVAASGGQPRRLTWHPGADVAVGWTPDGKSVLIRSQRTAFRDLDDLFVVDAAGGPVRPLPLPSGEFGSYSPDGQRLAYEPISQWEPAWKQYRGGQTSRIWLADLATSHVTPIPRPNSNDKNPMWVGDTVYFLSDRQGPVTLYSYDVKTGAVSQKVDNHNGFDMASASAGPGGIVIDGFGKLEIFDLASGQVSTVPVTLDADLPQVRPHFEPLKADLVDHARLTPSGKRMVFSAHGEILSAPAEKGEIRNLTRSPGVADRDPTPSPDGRSVAYFSDADGEYALYIRDAEGVGPARRIGLGTPPSFFYDPIWSPDSKAIVFHDKRLNLWLVNADGKTAPRKVDTDLFDSPAFDLDPAWSADGRWIAYTKQLPNHLHAAFVYEVETGQIHQITDGSSDVGSPRFDRSGKYLYFTASTSRGLGSGWLDMSSLGRATDASVYVAVLRKDLPNPVAPESDEETPSPAAASADAGKGDAGKGDGGRTGSKGKAEASAKTEGPARVTIDFDGLDQRILALPIARANFDDLQVGEDGVVYTVAEPSARTDEDMLAAREAPDQVVSRFTLKDRKTTQLAEGVDHGSFTLSADGKTMLLSVGGKWTIAAADAPLKPGVGAVKLSDMSVWVDPRAEWRQMYNEVWRIERDFFYDPHLHGLDLSRARSLYARYLPGIAARQDLNTLFEEMTGQIEVGHMFIRGGALPPEGKDNVGLLGADWETANGHWRIAKILRGENYTPSLNAPLSQPGVDVRDGDYLLAVNGEPVSAEASLYKAFEGTAGKHTVITVSAEATGANPRQVTVVPIASEMNLRLHDWMVHNREVVDRLSGGKVAYVYVPDTATGGFANFNRYYFSQVGKDGAIIDERYNHGGDIADFIVDELRRTPQMVDETREGASTVEPEAAIFGPKVMITNEMSGSGGDALPWLFKKNHVGVMVGERTWGGLVGIGGYPPLIDGGSVTAPRWAIYGTHGGWEVENIGIAPDIEVPEDPEALRQGHDPQLERAVSEALEAIKAHPPQTFPQAPYPVKNQVLPEE